MAASFHIQYFDPCNPHWPKGGWSVYQIDGDRIAQSVIWEGYDLERGFPKGKIKFRHPWSGYLGIAETLEDAMKLIAADKVRVA